MREQPLPDLYAPWLRDLLGGPVPREEKATCDDCAMCVKPDGRLPTATDAFKPDLKCCVFTPRLPNFLVGRILLDEDPSPAAAHGRRSVEARLAAQVGVTPLGLERGAGLQLHYDHTPDAFGRSLALRCPHFVEDGGLCGIWKHRESTCATWFCQFERGRHGFAFWQALRGLLADIELALSIEAALAAGVEAGWLAPLLPPARGDAGPPRQLSWPELEGRVDGVAYATLWGPWTGREVELYQACARRVEGLAWPDVLLRCGPAIAVRAAEVRRAHLQLMTPGVPVRLRAGAFQVAATRRDGGLRAVTFSSYDALDLPLALVPVLPAFDGRPTHEVLLELRAQGVELEPSLLQRLFDWGVLVSAGSA